MADKNNLLLTIVLVAGALMLFNGGSPGLSGNAVSDDFGSCAKVGSTMCSNGNVIKCIDAGMSKSGSRTGRTVIQDICSTNEQCVQIQIGGTTGSSGATCVAANSRNI